MNILLCVVGLTPQVITETVYALAGEAQQGLARLPDRIEVITTTEGARRVKLSLFSEGGGRGHFEALCADLGIVRSQIDFAPESILVIPDRDGRGLEDIADRAGNAAAADCINRRIQHWCSDDTASLHVSLAGGRKTMGFYAGYALSLHGREQDRLSHVLVNTPFESHPEFFYPPATPRTLLLPGGRDYVSTGDAEVTLADLPFVRMRDGFDPRLLDGTATFSDAVTATQQVLQEPRMVLNVPNRTVSIHGCRRSMSSTQFVWLLWLATRAQRELPAVAFGSDAFPGLFEAIDAVEGSGPCRARDNLERARSDYEATGSTDYFDRCRSRLNSVLRAQFSLHPAVVKRYLVKSVGRRPRTRYCLDLNPGQLQIIQR